MTKNSKLKLKEKRANVMRFLIKLLSTDNRKEAPNKPQ